MGANNPWSSARKAARRSKKHMAAQYQREFMMDPEELEKEEEDGNYKTNKKVK